MVLLTVLVTLELHVAVFGAPDIYSYTASTTRTITTSRSSSRSGSPLTTENVKFVQKLKADLRRDNDDYLLGRNLTKTVPPPPQRRRGSSEHSSAYIDDIEEVYRRALVERGTQHVTTRNKTNTRPAPKARSRPVHSPVPHNMIKETNNKMAGFENGIKYFRTMDRSREKAIIPSPDQIDMAPAKGGKIEVLRGKNRLCQRHVLIPEGPKYDSKGRVYLRAHPPNAARPYGRTRSPRLLLPRCCNCCKKSVLGCE